MFESKQLSIVAANPNHTKVNVKTDQTTDMSGSNGFDIQKSGFPVSIWVEYSFTKLLLSQFISMIHNTKFYTDVIKYYSCTFVKFILEILYFNEMKKNFDEIRWIFWVRENDLAVSIWEKFV